MNQFPYTNFHDVNLDWLLKQTGENTTDISKFESEITTINSELDTLQNEIENISSLYLCTFGVTTNSEIESALNDKKLPICIYNGHIYVISQRVSANRHRFGSVYRTESEALECLLDSWLTQSDTFASTTYVNTQIANAAEVFWAEYGVTSPAEIHAANAAGKVCALIYGNSTIYYLVSDDGDDGIYFGSPLGEGSQSWILVTGNPTTWDLPISRQIPIASNVTPMALGTASPGTQLEYSRRDHVHPMPDAGKIPYDENENYSSGTVGNELSDLKITDDYIGYKEINPGADGTGYYTGTVGQTIVYNAQASSHSFSIDLTDYINMMVMVSFTTTNNASTRIIALCDTNDVIVDYVTEANLKNSFGGSYAFYPTATNKKLYISYSSLGSNLKVEALSNMSETVQEMYNDFTKTFYVDASVVTSGNGSRTNPFKTITEAITNKGKTIYVKPGTYTETFILTGYKNLTIAPYPYNTYDASNPVYDDKIVLDETGTNNYGILMTNCHNVTFIGIKCINFNYYGFDIQNCTNISVKNCEAGNQNGTYIYGCGFRLTNTNGEFVNCTAHNVILDGFNIHGYGVTKFINCNAYSCGDDGISHHDACVGIIQGGEFYSCGKGGVSSPTHGAYINVYDVYSHNNDYGIYTATTVGVRNCKAIISNCVCKNNTTDDILIYGTDAIGWNNIYDTKNVLTGATFTEY